MLPVRLDGRVDVAQLLGLDAAAVDRVPGDHFAVLGAGHDVVAIYRNKNRLKL